MNLQIKFLLLFCLLFIKINEATQCQQSSQNGMELPVSGTIRVFLVFAECINDPNYSLINKSSWPPGEMPAKPDTFFDTIYNASEIHGAITKLYSEASFGKLVILGDYLNELVQIDYNTMIGKGATQVLDYLNDSIDSSTIITANGYDINGDDFDRWVVVCGRAGDTTYLPKVEAEDDYIDILYILWRVNSKINVDNTNYNSGKSYHDIKDKNGINLLIHGTNYTGNNWGVVRHEIAHSLIGGNEFHTGGRCGETGRATLSKQGGYSLLNYDHGVLGTLYNGFDRWRLGWKDSNKQYYISALDANTLTPINTALNYLPGAQYHDYILRDFVSTGDVIRIKLPYVQSESDTVRNQYLWLENHQMVSDLDLANRNAKGIYAYIQVGYDSLNLFGNGDQQYLTFLQGLGNYDISYDDASAFYINYDKANPFTGNSVIQAAAFNLVEPNIDSTVTPWVYYTDKILAGEVINAQAVVKDGYRLPASDYAYLTWPGWGTIHDPFLAGCKIGISSNPSAVPVLTYQVVSGVPNLTSQPYDNRNIYLNGLSFEVLEIQANGDAKVRIRYRDFDVNNDVRWCGPIVLKERVDLKNGTILLDQGLTPTRPVNPIPFNGDTIYASPTVFTTKAQGYFKMFEGTQVVVKNNSAFVSEQYGSLEIKDDAVYTLKTGSTLALRYGSNLLIRGSGSIEVESGGYICIEPGATITLEDPLSVINLRNGYHAGVNPDVLKGFNCSSNPAGAAVSGSGHINANFNENVFVQKTTITTNRYISGNNVSIGREVDPTQSYGDVLITSGKEVIVDATNDILLDKGFEAALGCTFELR
jgi:hypothetical protein